MRLSPRTLLFAALVAAGPAVPGADPVRLTSGEAARLARDASSTLGRFRALEDAASADVRLARAQRRPFFEASAGYARLSNVPELTLSLPTVGTQTIFPNITDNWRTRVDVSVPLYTGGRITATEAMTSSLDAAARGDTAAVEADVVLEAVAAFWRLATARERRRVLTESLASYDAHLADARNRVELGFVARNEILAVQVERDRAELARLLAVSEASIAEADLLRLTGLPPGTALELDPGAETASGPDADAERTPEAAVERRAELAALRARVDAAGSRRRAERAGYLPTISASAGYDYANPNRRVLPQDASWKGTWEAGVWLSVPIWDGGRTRATVARAAAEEAALERQLEDREQRVRLEVITRRLERDTAAAALAMAERSLESAIENRRIARDRYREGFVTSAELLDAEAAELRAGLAKADATAALRVAGAALDRAAGLLP